MLPITSKQVVNLFVAEKCIGAIGNNGAGFMRCVNSTAGAVGSGERPLAAALP